MEKIKIEIEMENGGIIKAELYPEIAPITVNNFVNLINDNFFDGLIFHRVIKDFMIQGGDPTGTGMGGESIWGKAFPDEFDPKRHNLRGALSMANAGPNTNGSQFFIVQANTVPEHLLEQMEEMPSAFSKDVIEAYKELGGTPWLDFRPTVFGQVMEGLDTVDQIENTPAGSADKHVNVVLIETNEFKTIYFK